MSIRPLSDYQVGAALAVARQIDPEGNDRLTLDGAWVHAATHGKWPAEQLQRGRDLLLAAALLEADGGRITLSVPLAVVASMPDPQAMTVLRQLLTESFQGPLAESRRIEVGIAAEEFVAAECRSELEELGRSELAAQVHRVSLVSDRFGYDVTAPTLSETSRLLEVKGSTSTSDDVFRFFLSRNEYDVGRRSPGSWFLVACRVAGAADEDIALLGHCPAATLEPYLPADGNGRWTEAAVVVPLYVLAGGLPTPVP